MKHLASLLLIGGVVAQWHSEVAYDGNFSFLTDPLYQASVATAHTISKWPAGNLPFICHDHMTFRSCPDANVEVYNVTYTDVSKNFLSFEEFNSGGVDISLLVFSPLGLLSMQYNPRYHYPLRRSLWSYASAHAKPSPPSRYGPKLWAMWWSHCLGG